MESARHLIAVLFFPRYFLSCITYYHSFVPIQVSAYLLGEYGHLLSRRPGCSPKELFAIINDKLPTVS